MSWCNFKQSLILSMIIVLERKQIRCGNFSVEDIKMTSPALQASSTGVSLGVLTSPLLVVFKRTSDRIFVLFLSHHQAVALTILFLLRWDGYISLNHKTSGSFSPLWNSSAQTSSIDIQDKRQYNNNLWERINPITVLGFIYTENHSQ